MRSGEDLIDVRSIGKTYGMDGSSSTVLHDVSFTVKKGEFVSIMGPSGSGKSTLLHILGFLDSATEGEYYFDGKPASAYSPEECADIRNRRIGFVFQAFNLLARTSVLENVKLPLLYSRVPEREWNERARSALEAVGLTHRLDYPPSKLSGGERQRVAIARALVNEPDLIFADEPTGNLDSKSGTQVLELIDDLQDKGHTVILVTHETYTAEYAERIIRIFDGTLESDTAVADRHRKTALKK
ncbi:MAG: ABC transporter ATP-binding protein [Patescibacteria group bacterium]